jgi:hypothetical protein
MLEVNFNKNNNPLKGENTLYKACPACDELLNSMCKEATTNTKKKYHGKKGKGGKRGGGKGGKGGRIDPKLTAHRF